MKEQLATIRSEALAAFAQAGSSAELDALRVKYLGKKGELTAVLKQMGKLSAEERPAMGQLANEVRAALEAELEAKGKELEAKALEARLEAEALDVTVPGKPVTMVNLDPDAIERTITITPTRVKQLLVPHILNGELAIELPGIAEKKAYIAKQLTEETWETELRIEMPHKHYVNMTPAVAECRAKMYSELHGGKV